MTFNWNGQQLISAVNAAADKAARDCAFDLLAKSGAEVPHDAGALEQSGAVDKAADGEYIVSYGRGITASYALKQHENLALNHQRGRKAKYLEDPLNAQKDSPYVIKS